MSAPTSPSPSSDGQPLTEPTVLLARLAALKGLAPKLQRLTQLQRSLAHQCSLLSAEGSVVEEYRKELAALAAEKEDCLRALHDTHTDLQTVEGALQALSREQQQLVGQQQQRVAGGLQGAKEAVDLLRAQHGLPRTAHWQDEQDTRLAEYLEQRRHSWRAAMAEHEAEESRASHKSRSRKRSRRD